MITSLPERTDLVTRFVRGKIIRGEIHRGERLPPERVSRTTVRAGLQLGGQTLVQPRFDPGLTP